MLAPRGNPLAASALQLIDGCMHARKEARNSVYYCTTRRSEFCRKRITYIIRRETKITVISRFLMEKGEWFWRLEVSFKAPARRLERIINHNIYGSSFVWSVSKDLSLSAGRKLIFDIRKNCINASPDGAFLFSFTTRDPQLRDFRGEPNPSASSNIAPGTIN